MRFLLPSSFGQPRQITAFGQLPQLRSLQDKREGQAVHATILPSCS